MRNLLVCLMVLASLSTRALGSIGGQEGGGGDGDVIEFLGIAVNISYWLHLNPDQCKKLNCGFFESYVSRLERQLGDPKVEALVQFADRQLEDQYGIQKQALFDPSTQKITVNRKEWIELSSDRHKKYDLVAAEIFGLGGVSDRYLEAGLIGDNVAAIEEANQKISTLDAWEVCSTVVKAEAEKRALVAVQKWSSGTQVSFKVGQTYGIKTLNSKPYRFSSTTTFEVKWLGPSGESLSQFEKLNIRSQATPNEIIPVAPGAYKEIGPSCAIIN